MSINFPNSPSNNDRHLDFIYDATNDVWNRLLTQSINDFGDVEVISPSNNSTLVFDEDLQKWVVGASAVSTGQIFAFAGSTAPDGYLLCNGTDVSRTTYANLFAVIGTTYGAGEGGATFNLPNMSTRVPVHINSSDSDFNTLGETGGAKSVTLDVTQIPSHTHTQLPHNHIQNAHNHTQPSHSHTLNQQFYPSGWEGANYGTGFYGSFRGRTIIQSGTGIGSDGRAPAIQNTTAINQNTTAVNQNTGGGQAHNNLQPYVVVQYIIKT